MTPPAALALVALAQACAAQPPAAPAPGQAPHSTAGIGYASVEAAFRAVKADPHAAVAVEGDWMVFTQRDGSAATTWRFTRPGHPAHPSVVRQRLDSAAGTSDSATLCQSHLQAACAQLDKRD